jgi:hypothetical protein
MDDDALWLDGNALAGELRALFGTEMTTAQHGCRSCGRRNAVGAHRLYRGAGVVLRCPVCGDLAMCLAVLPDRDVVRVTGTWTLDLPGA